MNVTSSVPIVFWYIFVLVVSFGVRDLCAGSEGEGHKTVQFFFRFWYLELSLTESESSAEVK